MSVWPQFKKTFHILMWTRKDWKSRYLYWPCINPVSLSVSENEAVFSSLNFPLASDVSVPVNCLRPYKCWSLRGLFSRVSFFTSADCLGVWQTALAFVAGGMISVKVKSLTELWRHHLRVPLPAWYLWHVSMLTCCTRTCSHTYTTTQSPIDISHNLKREQDRNLHSPCFRFF